MIPIICLLNYNKNDTRGSATKVWRHETSQDFYELFQTIFRRYFTI